MRRSQTGKCIKTEGEAETAQRKKMRRMERGAVKYGCRLSMCAYPEEQSGGVVCSHQAVDGLEKPPQRLLKLCLLLPFVQPG